MFPRISGAAGGWAEQLSSVEIMMQSFGNPTDSQCFLACFITLWSGTDVVLPFD